MTSLTDVISASEARSNLYKIIEEVSKKLKRITITLRGKAKVVIMHPDEVASWDETMDVLSNKSLVKDIRDGIKDVQEGSVVSEESLLKKLGISDADLK